MIPASGDPDLVFGLLSLEFEGATPFVALFDRIAFGHDRSFYGERLRGKQDLATNCGVGPLRAETDAGIQPLHRVTPTAVVARLRDPATTVQDMQHATASSASQKPCKQSLTATRRLRCTRWLAEGIPSQTVLVLFVLFP